VVETAVRRAAVLFDEDRQRELGERTLQCISCAQILGARPPVPLDFVGGA